MRRNPLEFNSAADLGAGGQTTYDPNNPQGYKSDPEIEALLRKYGQ
jgi:hypothetical protein